MNTLTQPLRDEHKELIPHIEQILKVADKLTDAPGEQIRSGIQEVYEFLAYHLIPHAQAEEAALYPVVQQVLGSPEATRTMSSRPCGSGPLCRGARCAATGSLSPEYEVPPACVVWTLCPGKGPLCQGGGSLSADPGRASLPGAGPGHVRSHGSCRGSGKTGCACSLKFPNDFPENTNGMPFVFLFDL